MKFDKNRSCLYHVKVTDEMCIFGFNTQIPYLAPLHKMHKFNGSDYTIVFFELFPECLIPKGLIPECLKHDSQGNFQVSYVGTNVNLIMRFRKRWHPA